ncbi:MAG: Fibronectin type domain protein [Myxococcales bacterium]|nr:Fibronectin type domain protein [Myxococcales bacterium]
MWRSLRIVIPAVLTACAAGPDTGTISSSVDDLPVSDGYAYATGGWINRPIPQHQNDTVTIQLEATPYSNGELVDAVVGFSSQRAAAFSDLGPILRFNDTGIVDARSAGAYRASSTFSYVPNTTYSVRFVIDLYAKRYSADVKIADTRVADVWHPIAVNYAFRTEQSALSRIDNVASYIDSPTGAISTGYFSVTPDVCISGSPGWVAFPFPTQMGQFTVQADVTPNAGNWQQTLDAVVGLSRFHPKAFTDVAAILRFRPDGYMDARNGSTYATDTTQPYENQYYPNGALRVYFFVDQTANTYSVYVRDLNNAHGGWPQSYIGHEYAFRSEQSGVISLGWIGGFVDGPGTIRICNVVASQ